VSQFTNGGCDTAQAGAVAGQVVAVVDDEPDALEQQVLWLDVDHADLRSDNGVHIARLEVPSARGRSPGAQI
jgi:hypothetical protein